MKKILLCVCAAAALFSSCKKNKDEEAAPAATSCRIQYVKDGLNGDSLDFVYDAQGRIASLTRYSGSTVVYTETYTYQSGKLLLTSFDDTGAQDGPVEEYYLNPNGTIKYRAVMTVYTMNTDYDTTFFSYDAEGHNSGTTHSHTSVGTGGTTVSRDTLWNTYTGGNLVTIKYKNASGNIQEVTQTYSALENKNNLFFEDDLAIKGIYGTGSKNLVSGDSDGDVYSYELNADGLITRLMIDYDANVAGLDEDSHIVYSCQ